jgi:pilus assembly protein CpaF
MEGEIITLQDIFSFDYSSGIDEMGNFRGIIKPTGLRPKFMTKLNDYGISIAADAFDPGF